jgi:hypothetical protein
MTAVDARCVALARFFLQDYNLTPAERNEEAERIAQDIQRAIEAELEQLEHRKR